MNKLNNILHIYNNYCNSQIDVDKKNTNKYENDINKQKKFVNLIVIIPKHIRNIGIIRKNMHYNESIVNYIITNKMNIDYNCEISNKILEYIPITCPNIEHKESRVSMNRKRISLFIKKCHYDNLIQLNNDIIKTLSLNYIQHTHFGGFLYYLNAYLNYNDLTFFNSYEEYYEYILYWLDYSGEHSAHYYKMKNLTI